MPAAAPAFAVPVPDAVHRVDVGGASLHVEEYGAGPPLLLLGGLGASTLLWFRQIDALRRRFRVVAPDNRGAGRSDAPPGPYTIALLAADALAVLDALGIERAHVLGASMGGYIAQELALAHPDRVDRLVLACTTMGGPDGVAPEPGVLEAFFATDVDPAAHLRRLYGLFAAPEWLRTHAALVDGFIAHRLRTPTPSHAFAAQAEAAGAFDASTRLAGLRVPTLVLHGTDDRVVPAANAQRLAAAVPGALLQLIPGTGHVFFQEQPEAFNAAVERFLA